MRVVWDRIEAWLANNAPQVLETLKPGASTEEIKQAESFFDVTFPEDFKLSYLIHNGQHEESYSLFPNLELLSLESMIKISQKWQEFSNEDFTCAINDISPGVWNGWWHPHWLPFTYESNGACQCVDLAPEFGGQAGQIISVEWQEPFRAVIAPSFQTYLETFTDELERGEYRFSENGYGLVDLVDFEILESDD